MNGHALLGATPLRGGSKFASIVYAHDIKSLGQITLLEMPKYTLLCTRYVQNIPGSCIVMFEQI